MAKKLVIMPPSFRRKKSDKPLPAIDMYDGVLYRVLRRNMPKEGLDVVILTEDMQLIFGSEKIPYRPPKGNKRWTGYVKEEISEEVINRNLEFLRQLFDVKNYDEVFVALGRRWRKAIKGIEQLANEKKIKISFISGKGLGFYESSLKKWLKSIGGGK